VNTRPLCVDSFAPESGQFTNAQPPKGRDKNERSVSNIDRGCQASYVVWREDPHFLTFDSWEWDAITGVQMNAPRYDGRRHDFP